MEKGIRVNGRSLDEELKRIDDFFDNLSDVEFVEMIKRNGADTIEESYKSSYVLATQLIMCQKSNLTKNRLYKSEQCGEFALDINRGRAA